ncbi:Serine/threonine-protein kinase PrkC [Nocardia cerradoensis]|uniref:non-specific serine/threonine protein kinase n=1 Tax=Nocardia cerradoensis TaxID=85688 RepID=A0A231GVX0_9NOCA|nr:protein kinase [Nocardia cerradoensis]OXR40746.1 Serine/threonine-protein kinase PrkC [Nocardia cerradoensis]
MARLHVLGDWHGPGEEKAANTLASRLPDEWDVIAGRQIPTHTGTVDLDLVVVGQQAIYVCEEKAWGPLVDAGEVTWYVNGQQRSNPVDQVAHASRVLAGRLRDKIAGWASTVFKMPRGTHLVTGHVVMSHPQLELRGADDLGEDKVLPLADAPAVLLAHDSARPEGFAALRPKVMSYLLGLRERNPDEKPNQIMQYRVAELLRSDGNSLVYAAFNPADQIVFLNCVPLANAEDPVAAGNLAVREHDALALLARENRTWEVRDWFDWDGYRVTPIRPDLSGTSLYKATCDRAVDTDSDGRVSADIATPIVLDAFTALASVHARGIMHRALQPRSIEVADDHTVRFRDFGRSRIPSAQTVAPGLTDDHPSTPFRAPNATLEFFNTKDDVYSLALCLIQWIHGDSSEQPDHELARTRAANYPQLGAILNRCLAPHYADRPEAADMVALFGTSAAVLEPDADEPRPEALVAGRYRLHRQLGEGTHATTWLATDERAPGERTLKYLRRDRVSRKQAVEEFTNTDLMHSRFCARVYDLLPEPEPGVIVQEYVPGHTLKELAESTALDGAAFRRIAIDIVSGLEDAHQHGIYHRDVSPSNIIVCEDGSARLIDFGLATSPDNARSAVGSPPFTAPEVWANGDWSPAADLYSAAASLLTAMLGRYPYSSVDMPGRSTLIAPSGEHRQRYGAGLLDALYSAVATDPAERPQSAAELKALLQESISLTERVNSTVAALRGLYRHSGTGNAGNRGLDDEFAHKTYAPTWLDIHLLPAIIERRLDVVVLSGNPGDGKTSFLVKVGAALDERGAVVEHKDGAGWRKTLDKHTFVAVYDASESNGTQSSDDMLIAALGDIENNTGRTVLIAANDGRVTQFFTENEDLYPDTARALLQQRQNDADNRARVVLVDLKRRALATHAGAEPGLSEQILNLFTAPERWAVCSECTAFESCPIRRNATTLRAVRTRAAIAELVLTSHLRRRRRATVRDIRSAFSWLITGDLSCDQIHAEIADGADPAPDERLLPHLVFGGDSSDYLLQEWAELDPAELPTPGAVRAARTRRDLIPNTHDITPGELRRLKRALFLGLWDFPHGRKESRSYRYLETYLEALTAPEQALPLFIFGLSRVLGYVGYDGKRLALRDQAYDARAVRAIVVIKELAEDEFALTAEGTSSPYLESFPDMLSLRHSSGVTLRINLDTAELLLRAADGEILGDLASEAIRQEIVGFGNRLRREPAHAVRVIDGSGRSLRAVAVDGRIVGENMS